MRSNPDSRKNPFSRRRQVPDYTARRVQFRLAVLVFAVMTVLMMMHKAGQPETWAWMNFGKQTANEQAVGVAVDYRSIDTKFSMPEGDMDRPTQVVTIADALADPDQRARLGIAAADGDEVSLADIDGEHDFEIAERDFWQKTYGRLNSTDKDVLFHLLRAAIYQEQPDSQLSSRWPELSARIDQRRQAYYAQVEQRIEALGESASGKSGDESVQKERWTNTLAMMRQFWDRQANPYLLAIAAEPIATPDAEKKELPTLPDRQNVQAATQLLTFVEAIALSRVEDSAMTSKSSDMQAWFGIFDRLKRMTDTEIADASQGQVSYVQLFEQPELYRDHVVTVRGQVRAVWWVPAPKNVHGIERYYVYWIRPNDGSNNPIAVYALEKPPGFPEINRKHLDSDKEEWNEPVVVHAVFLKKWVYLSQDSSRVCPLLLARSVQWEPDLEAAATPELPGIPVILGTILAIGLVAIAIAVFAYRLTSRELPHARSRESEVLKFDVDQVADHS